MREVHESIRGHFAAGLHALMAADSRVWLLTADLGRGMWNAVREDYPERYVNAGASEQAMVGAAVGLAQEGKVPFCYSITPFLVYRPFEWLRNYLQHEGAGVKLVGSGLGTDYGADGFTHHCEELPEVLACLPRIRTWHPATLDEARKVASEMAATDGPCFAGLRR